MHLHNYSGLQWGPFALSCSLSTEQSFLHEKALKVAQNIADGWKELGGFLLRHANEWYRTGPCWQEALQS